MTANIWKDGKVVFWSVEVSLTDSLDLSDTRQWEGTFRIKGGDRFDVRGSYSVELDDGKSAQIVLTHVLKREQAVVHFRVLAWKGEAHAFNSVPGRV